MTPVTKVTFRASAALVIAAVAAILTGHFVIAAILGTTAAINLLAGVMLKKY